MRPLALKTNDSKFFTPPVKRKADAICESPVLPSVGKYQVKKPSCMQQAHNVDAKILFHESGGAEVVKGHLKTKKGTKELHDVCDQEHFTKEKKQGFHLLSFVSEDEPNSNASQPSKFHVTPLEKRYYKAICSLASSNYARSVAVDIGGCYVNFFALGDSMAPGKLVCSFVINCFCRKFFMDEPPTKSRKHYFFSSISEVFLSECPDFSFVEHCFTRAASVLPFSQCEMLLFPVLYEKHWFLFVVDLENKMFIFLDSYYSSSHYFSIHTRKKLKKSFRQAWDMFVGRDPGFIDFRTSYAHVPKQDNQADCGVFPIKFMELWKFGRDMLQVFCQQDILNIRVQIVNGLLFSKHNTADVKIVKNFNANGALPSMA